MGSSTSTLDVHNSFQALLSHEPPTERQLRSILDFTLSDSEIEQILPLNTLRELRHLYTANFALLLHACIAEVGTMAQRKLAANVAGAYPAKTIPHESIPVFLTALQLLRRLLPVAMEDGDTPLESKGAPRASPKPRQNRGRVGASPQPRPDPEQDAEDMRDMRAPFGAAASSVYTECSVTVPCQGAGPPHPLNTDPPPAPPPAAPTPRTVSTANFQDSFFHKGSKCVDERPNECFRALPGQRLPATSRSHGLEGSVSAAAAEIVPLGVYLVFSLVECCFIRGLTLDHRQSFPDELRHSLTHPDVVESLLWAPGVGSADPKERLKARPTALIANVRKALLQTLLSVVAKALYHPANHRDTTFMEPLISVTTVPLMPTLVVSLLNTLITYEPYGALPFTSHLVDDEEQVMMNALSVLCATVSYSGIPIDPYSGTAVGSHSRHSGPVTPAPASTVHEDSRDMNDASHLGNVPHLHTVKPPVDVGAPLEAFSAYADDSANVAPDSQLNAADSSGHLAATIDFSLSTTARARPASNTEGHRSSLVSGPLESGEHLNASGKRSSRHSRTVSPSAPSRVPRFVHSVRKTLHDISLTEATLIVTGLSGLTGLRAYACNTVLPDSQRIIPCEDDLMMLLWRLVELSPSVYTQLSASPNVLGYLVPLMQYAMDARQDANKVDHLQVALFTISRLSEKRSFVVMCNQPFTGLIPFAYPRAPATSTTPASPSTFNDFLVVCLCQLLGSKLLASCQLLTSCSIALANLTPYITDLGPVASSSLVRTFSLYATRCMRLPCPSDTPSPGEPGSAGGGQPSLAGAEKYILAQSVLVNVTESIASLLQYHENGSRYVLASLLDHAGVVKRTKEVFLVNRTRPILYHTTVPFLVDCLDAAVSAVASVRFLAESAGVIVGNSRPLRGGGGVSTGGSGGAGTDAEDLAGVAADGGAEGDRGGGQALSSTPPPQAEIAGSLFTGLGARQSLSPFAGAPAPFITSVADVPGVMAKICAITLVGELPPPHRITTRRMLSTRQSELWAYCAFWTGVYVRTPGGWMGDSRSVKLLRFA